ncbi:hypothetical protein ONB67_00725 [Candidatus Vidania fulgoroideae]|uniref:Uncharacterized protein n=1 Tax=Candidatus Vidania fulgoroideorum TaxID=881286 RepID=A0AAX3NBG5_9PROT|nr:hypothetical protein ONB67_00725 [Candidatus Vidania fulgoroideae]
MKKKIIYYVKKCLTAYNLGNFLSFINIVEPLYSNDISYARKEIKENEETENIEENEDVEIIKKEEEVTFHSVSKKVIDFLIDDLGICLKINPLTGLNFVLICKGLFKGCSLLKKIVDICKGFCIKLLFYKNDVLDINTFRIINSCQNRGGLYCLIMNILLYPISFFIRTLNEKK